MPDLIHLVSPFTALSEVKHQGLLLAPFLNAVIVYFAFVRDEPKGDVWSTFLKCLPIVFLMMYTVVKGFDFTKEFKYSQRILLGLVFSCIGDALLNVDLFPHGMGSFAIAQICYIAAFGWTPIKWAIGVPLYVAGAIVVGFVFQSLEGVLVVGLPVYSALLLTMCWRSLARAADECHVVNVLCGIASFLFVISDALIGVNMFIYELPYARLLIMSTYYFAQFGITLSTVTEAKTLRVSPKRSKASTKSRLNGSQSAGHRRKKTAD